MPKTPSKMVRVGSDTNPRCHGCGRSVKKGHERKLPDGNIYGPECGKRALERINSGQGSVVQERFV